MPVLGDAACVEGVGNAEVAEGAVGAAGVFYRCGQGGRTETGAEGKEGIGELLSKFGGEGNFAATAGAVVVDGSACDGLPKHFFEAEGLSAELEVVVAFLAAGSVLVFNGDDCTVGVEFDGVGASGEAEGFRPEGESAFDADFAVHLERGFIHALVDLLTAQGEDVFVVDLLDVDEGALAGAVGVVFDGGNHDVVVWEGVHGFTTFPAERQFCPSACVQLCYSPTSFVRVTPSGKSRSLRDVT